MRIGLISDTHIPENAKVVAVEAKEAFRNVDLILHAGDIYIPSVLDELECIAPVLAAAGDDDFSEMRNDGRVKERHVLNIEGTTIWLTHMMSRAWLQHEKAPDIIVLGHDHRAAIGNRDGILLVSPGSATSPHYKGDTPTVALLEVNSGKIRVSIVHLWEEYYSLGLTYGDF